MEDVNGDFPQTDVVPGDWPNDVTNPAARTDASKPDFWHARS